MSEEKKYPPPERRRGYEELKEMIDAHARIVEKRFHRWFVTGLVAFSTIGFSSFIAIIGFGFTLKEHDHILEEQKHISFDIQAQRRDTVLRGCQDTNRRNRGAQTELRVRAEQDLAKIKDPVVRQAFRNARTRDAALINAVVPIQDCQALVKQAVKPPRTP